VILPERLELPRRSMVMLEQIRVLDKQRLREYVDCMEADEAVEGLLEKG
jgi:mRNA-degrading endonuclease toxin of MazEF toxin-antitoxin module